MAPPAGSTLRCRFEGGKPPVAPAAAAVPMVPAVPLVPAPVPERSDPKVLFRGELGVDGGGGIMLVVSA